MDNSLLITLAILAAPLVAFLIDRIPADIVALLVAVALGLTGVLTTEEAFSGFSRAAVIIIIAIFILAECLKRTGVTEKVGDFLLKIGGSGEIRLTVAVMAFGAFLSVFMNNIAAAAVLMPAVSGAAKRNRRGCSGASAAWRPRGRRGGLCSACANRRLAYGGSRRIYPARL